MPSTTAELIADVKDGAGDIDDATALRYLNKRQRTMCQRSGWYRQMFILAMTVAGQDAYGYVSDVFEVFTLTVGGVPYTKRSPADLERLKAGWSTLVGDGGFFVVTDVSQITLYPAPSESGLQIQGLVSLTPPDLVSGASDPVVPDPFTDALVEGAIATWLARKDENFGSADRNEARFDNACEELRRYAKRRFRPGGVAQVRVLGVNA